MILHGLQNRSQFIKLADEDFDQLDPVRNACIKIIDHLIKNPEQKKRKLSFQMLRRIAELTAADNEILYGAIAYLVGERVKALQMRLEYQDNSYFYELSRDEENDFHQNGTFIDPRNGEFVIDCASKIFIYFTTTDGKLH